MRVSELIEKAHLVIDPNGNKNAVQIDYETWEELLELLEDLEDLAEIDRIAEEGEDYRPWEQVKADLRAKGIDV